jgi:hypothetical protein
LKKITSVFKLFLFRCSEDEVLCQFRWKSDWACQFSATNEALSVAIVGLVLTCAAFIFGWIVLSLIWRNLDGDNLPILVTTLIVVSLNFAFFVLFAVQYNLPSVMHLSFNGSGTNNVVVDYNAANQTAFWLDKLSLLFAGIATQFLLFQLFAVVIDKRTCLSVVFWIVFGIQLVNFLLNVPYWFIKVIQTFVSHVLVLLFVFLFFCLFDCCLFCLFACLFVCLL